MTPQELRNSIIHLAIQGKLVEQREIETPVTIKSSLSGGISEFYEIPDGWKWVALKDVVTINTGLSFKKQDQLDATKGTLRVLRGGNIGDDYRYHLYDDDTYVDINQFQEKYIPLCEGDVISPSVTSIEKICKAGYIDTDLTNITAGGFVYIIRCKERSVLEPKYLLYFITSSFNKEQCKPNIHKSGQAFYNLKKSGLIKQPICLPPLAEQKRIVKKIEELLPLLDRYEEAWTKLEAFNKRFPGDMQKSILQMAIQGKLVPQDSSEGTGRELYEMIQAEETRLIEAGRIKREKPLDDITEEEIPFDIPDTWTWVKFGKLGRYKKGPFGSALTKSMFVPKGDKAVKVYEQKNAIQKNTSLGEYYISREYFEAKMTGFEVHPGDIIVSCAGTIGETYVLPENIEQGIINQALMRMQLFQPMYIPYFLMFFDVVLKQNARSGSKGSAIKNIPPFDVLKNYLVPIPPLAEQKRIVAKLDEILPLCEGLK